MGWLWFLCGSIFGLALGVVVTCTIVINRDIEEKENNGGINDND